MSCHVHALALNHCKPSILWLSAFNRITITRFTIKIPSSLTLCCSSNNKFLFLSFRFFFSVLYENTFYTSLFYTKTPHYSNLLIWVRDYHSTTLAIARNLREHPSTLLFLSRATFKQHCGGSGLREYFLYHRKGKSYRVCSTIRLNLWNLDREPAFYTLILCLSSIY